ncbi:putative gamma-tubulin complex component 2 [Apostichopus japonicus]|uniref:Gamma-tubulin complex component n=1 Tax=Stichopus japonicus TaxID=307972 RepID=A0A2G8LN85_STIJA|nr:putative gamma-tubulin complex component 2 [Apostichopus japonicus]
MSEFKVHHHVSELMHVLGIKGSEGPEVYAELMTKNIRPFISTLVSAHQAKRKIAEFTKTPEEFLRKYDDLKSKNVKDLDAMVFLISKLSDDKSTTSVLSQNAKLYEMPMDRASVPAPGTKMTQAELSEVRSQLQSLATSGGSSQASEMFRKMMREKQVKKNLNMTLPDLPPWVFDRPFLTRDYVVLNRAPITPGVTLGTLPVGMQEMAIVNDGAEGKYTTLAYNQDKSGERSIVVDPSLDPSLRELANRVIPICTNYSTIVHFTEDKSSFEYGMVNHALCGAMKTLLKEYNVLIAQLENQYKQGNLPLQKLWFYVQPCMHTMDILSSIATGINKGACTGGVVLSLLHERTLSMIGDARGQELCLFLTQSACAPYFELLEKWIFKGVIKDPYCEFMIEEHESMHKEKIQQDYNDAYWEQRYTICRDRIPVFLELLADKILRTGKYLNVVRQCGQNSNSPQAEEILYTLKERQYVDQIEKAYNYASKLLLDLVMEERELIPRLRSIKRYFLVEQGDFFVNLMDITEEEMRKMADDIIITRLESLLELALRTSQANSDPYKDDLRVELSPYDLITQLLRIHSIDSRQEQVLQAVDPSEIHISGLEAFSFDYVVKWPESLVLSRKALTKYQLIFRHLFYCKHVDRTLCNVWTLNKSAKQLLLKTSTWYLLAFALCQRMMHLVQNLQYYMLFEVVEPNWHILMDSLRKASNIDDVLAHHNDFLDKCLKDCMLTTPQLLKIVSKLMLVCVTFSNFIQRATRTLTVESETSLLLDPTTPRKESREDEMDTSDTDKRGVASRVVSGHVSQLDSSEDFAETVTNFDSNFSSLLIDLLDKLSLYSATNTEHTKMNIIHRLDFNGFYTEQLEKVAADRSMAAMEGQE